MNGERPIVIKLGGSVITRKQGAARLRPKVLHRLAEELVVDGPPRVVLHGAGSFGHPGAARWRLSTAPTDATRGHHRSRGAAIVSAEVRKLHVAVLRALVDAGGSPYSLPAAGLAINRGGKLAGLEVAPFREALKRNSVPVSFGDVVPDEQWGFSILSADTIAVDLARALGARQVLFVSDVPGVFERYDGGRGPIVAQLTPSVLAALAPPLKGRDVTGGIRGKVEAMLAIAEGGADAGLISGLSDGALARAIRGEAVYGSWARARSP